MALYAIGDLHLSLSADKPMDVFGSKWENYVERIAAAFGGYEKLGDRCRLFCFHGRGHGGSGGGGHGAAC